MKKFKITGLLDDEIVECEIESEDYETAYDYAYNYFDKAVHEVMEL